MSNKPGTPIEELKKISSSRKYKSINVPFDTLTSVYLLERKKVEQDKEAISILKAKLHNIVAPYLDRLDYNNANEWINKLPSSPSFDEIQSVCLKILSSHASTNERINSVPGFFTDLFNVTGKPQAIIDLACGFNPFFFPWMDLGTDVNYHAIDLHKPRIDLINIFFQKIGLPELATHDDFLIHPPQMHADIAFLFKEVHRLEQRQRGCNLPLWKKLNVDWLLVSLPTQNLAGTHSLLTKHRALINGIIKDESWKVEEIRFTNEIVFCINKKNK